MLCNALGDLIRRLNLLKGARSHPHLGPAEVHGLYFRIRSLFDYIDIRGLSEDMPDFFWLREWSCYHMASDIISIEIPDQHYIPNQDWFNFPRLGQEKARRWKRRAHLNPSVTLTFLRLGKIDPWDAFFYVFAQFVGGVAEVLLVALFFRELIAHPSVNYVVTVPGDRGAVVAFWAELLISFLLMLTVLTVSNRKNIARLTGLFAGILVATYITVEAPFSGMSMNPARTFGSAFPAHHWNAIWVYFTAPPLGMLLAAELYVRTVGIHRVLCAKLNHHSNKRCVFRCNY